MSFTVINCDQRSDDWLQARIGRLTGSVAADAMRTYKSDPKKFAASRRDLCTRLALERITGRSQEAEFSNAAVQHGVEREPVALARYEALSGEIVARTGFLSHDEVLAGCSLDAAIMEGKRISGIVEAKCPKSATHFHYLRTREIPYDYRWQCLHNLWVSGAAWCDFVSFDDRFPEDLQYLCVRMERDPKVIREYEIQVLRFLAEVAEEVDEVNKLRNAA